LKSGDKLRCTTCHDPHDIPRGEAASASYNAQYNSKCASCHPAGSIKTEVSAHQAGADCVSCHMPKRRTDDVVHVVMTDHYIQRRKPAGDLLAQKTEPPESEETAYRGEVVRYSPSPRPSTPRDTLIAAIAQVRDRANLAAGVPKLAALVKQPPDNAAYYGELAQGFRFAGDLSNAIENYREAAKRDRSSYRLAQLGNALMEARQFPEAERTLREATALAPNEPVAWATLGWVLWQEDKSTDAQAALQRSLQLDPELPESHNNLASVLWGSGQQDAALSEYREALRIQPGVADWRINLARALASRGQTAEAQREATEAARLAPNSADAHELSGALMISQGNPSGGIAELETAVRLQPDFGPAQYELGIALGQRGDTSRAVEHLRAALAGRDPEAAAAARQVLQTLRP